MEYENAFLGKETVPTHAEVEAVLGPVARLWDEFVEWMAREEGVATQEWKGVYVQKYGWSLRLKQKSRNIVYLSPGKDCFLVAFTLGDKALRAAAAAHLPKTVTDAIAHAPHYPEGTGLRFVVHRASDMGAMRKLAAIKLQN